MHAPTTFGAPDDRERARLRALEAAAILDTPPDEAFDRLTRLAARMFDAPIALVSLVDSDRQWFKSRHGIEVAETPRNHSFCAHAIRREDVMVVEDASLDERFRGSPLVVGDPGIRFYAGAPLRSPAGHALGSFCVIDRKPRTFGARERELLAGLAEIASAQIELHRKAGRVHEATRLPNRAQLAEYLEARAASNPGGRCGLMLIELISYRRMQETMLAVGSTPLEAALRGLAASLSAFLAPSSKLYHVGEARLCVALPSGSREEREAFAREALASLSEPFDAGGVAAQLRPVAGLAEFELSERGGADALRMATSALTQARARGERLRWHDPSADAAHRRAFALMREARGGIDRGEFRLVYQPKLCLADGRFNGVEALARWRHPELGDISPGEFIPLVERTALIHAFTPWALCEALAQARRWRGCGLDLSVGVNVSSRNLDAPGFAASVRELIASSGADASRLDIECTESAAMTSEAARATLSELRALGANLSLDDFGMGYSNLSCLRGLPIQTLKLDQSLVRPMESEPGARELVASLINLGRSLGFRMLAEGVETEAQRRMLAQDGCDELQGFLFARPMEASDVERFCAEAADGPEPRGARLSSKGASATSTVGTSARAIP